MRALLKKFQKLEYILITTIVKVPRSLEDFVLNQRSVDDNNERHISGRNLEKSLKKPLKPVVQKNTFFSRFWI